MERIRLGGTFPWEEGIEPDHSSETHEFYIEKEYSDKIKRNRATNRKIKAQENFWVILVREKNSDNLMWTIQKGNEVVYASKYLQSLYFIYESIRGGLWN